MKLLSVDPGKHTGWATWEFGLGEPTMLKMGVTPTVEAFTDFLLTEDWLTFGFVAYEDYLIRPAKLNRGWGHEWAGAPALHVIGALEFFSRLHGMELTKQPASILPVGCGYIGYNYRKGIHVPNNVSAIAHGAYWLVKHKYADSRGFKTLAS